MRDCQNYFAVNGHSPVTEAGSVTHEKFPSDERDRAIAITMEAGVHNVARNDSGATPSI